MSKRVLLSIVTLVLFVALTISSSTLVADVSEGVQFDLKAHREGLLTGSLSFIVSLPSVIVTDDGILNLDIGDTVTISFNTSRGNLEIHQMPDGRYTITMAQLDVLRIVVNGVTEYTDTTILGGSSANAESFTSTLQLFISSETTGKTRLIINGEVVIDDHNSDDEILLQDMTIGEHGILQVNLLRSHPGGPKEKCECQANARGVGRVYINGEEVSEFPGLMKGLILFFMIAMVLTYRKFGANMS